MTTFADLKSRIADEIDRSDLNSQIDRELRRAVEHYERQRFWFNETRVTTTATSSVQSVTPPTNLLILDHLELVASSRTVELWEISWSRFMDEWRFQTIVGEPQDYAWYANQVWLGPTPQQDYPLIWHYIQTLGSFSDGTDNAWTNFGGDLVSARTLKTLGSRTLKLSTQELLQYGTLEREAYTSLVGLSEQKMMTGRTRPWCG